MDEHREMKVTPDKYLTYRYAGASGDFNPIHLDDEFARSVGLPGRILHGLWTMAQCARAQGDGLKLQSLSVQATPSGGASVFRPHDEFAFMPALDMRRLIQAKQVSPVEIAERMPLRLRMALVSPFFVSPRLVHMRRG